MEDMDRDCFWGWLFCIFILLFLNGFCFFIIWFLCGLGFIWFLFGLGFMLWFGFFWFLFIEGCFMLLFFMGLLKFGCWKCGGLFWIGFFWIMMIKEFLGLLMMIFDVSVVGLLIFFRCYWLLYIYLNFLYKMLYFCIGWRGGFYLICSMVVL